MTHPLGLDAAGRPVLVKWMALALACVTLAIAAGVGAVAALAAQAVSRLTFRPPQAVAMAAYAAASRCSFTPDVAQGTADLVAVAWAQGSDGAVGFGRYRNPVSAGGDSDVPPDILAHVDRSALRAGGPTVRLLGLPAGLVPSDWTTVLPDPQGEHGVGFLLLDPSDWRRWVRDVPGAAAGANLDPYDAYDAFLVTACHLQLVAAAAGGGTGAVRQALMAFGSGVLQFADVVGQVASGDRERPWLIPADLLRAMPLVGPGRGLAFWARLQEELAGLDEPGGRGAGDLPVVAPIPAPSWVQRIPTPRWPADLAEHMRPAWVTNQCVAGALATWALMHTGDIRWNRPPPLGGNAIDLLGVARAEGFLVGATPSAGAMVIYGAAYGVFGHIATVRAVQGDRYEVVEQNFLDFDPAIEPHWRTFDLRSVAWPDPTVLGFIVAPP